VKRFLVRVWGEDHGVLSFEWILLVTLLVIGIVGGLSAVRDAVIDELGDVAEATGVIDQSYKVEAATCSSQCGCGSSFSFQDTATVVCRERPDREGQAIEVCGQR